MGMPIYVIADGTQDAAGNYITGTVQTYSFTGGIEDANLVEKTSDVSGVAMTNSEVKTAYEANADTNVYTDTDKVKVSNLPSNTENELSNKLDKGGYNGTAQDLNNDKLDKGGYNGTAQDLYNDKINNSEKGAANGVASLGLDGIVPQSQIRFTGYVGITTKSALDLLTGSSDIIYVVIADPNINLNGIYYWDGSLMVKGTQSNLNSIIPANTVDAVTSKAVFDYLQSFDFNIELDKVTQLDVDIIETALTQEYQTSTGSLAASGGGGWRTTDFIDVVAGEEIYYTLTNTLGQGTAWCIWGFDDNENVVQSLVQDSDGTVGQILEIPVGVTKIRASGQFNSPLSLWRLIRRFEMNAISGLLQNFAEFDERISNIYKVSDSEITPIITDKYVNISGAALSGAAWSTLPYKKVNYGDIVTYIGGTDVGSGAVLAVAGYDENFVFVTAVIDSANTVSGVQAQIPLGVSYIRGSSIKQVDSADIPFKITVNAKVVNPQSNIIDSQKSYCSIGTSITWQDSREYLSTGVQVKGYQTYLQEKILFSNFFNEGQSGKALTDVTGRDSIIDLTVDLPVSDIYTLEAVTNDFKLNVPIGSISNYTGNTGSSTYYGALRVMIDRFYQKNSQCQIALFSGIRRSNSGYTSTSVNTAGHTISDYNTAVEWVAKHEAIKFVDLFNESGITDRNLLEFTTDGLHPINSGYQRIASCIFPTFLKLI
jgi:hypothetical protein